MWIHSYELEAKNALNSVSKQRSRIGFLLKKQNSTNDVLKNFLSYSDFTYWPELGDPPMKDLKSHLIKVSTQDLDFPFSLTPKDLHPVKSNALISSLVNLGEQLEHLQDARFEVLKFKMGASFKTEYAALMQLNLKRYLVRIDLNNSLSFKESKEALEMLKKIPNLEYIEDPTPYHDYHWSELEKIVPLGLDQMESVKVIKPKHFQFRIVKPIRGFSLSELVQWTYEKKKVVVTNMMDSGVGTWKAYLYYCELNKHIPHHLGTPGFHTHTLFSNLPFAESLAFKGAEWVYDEAKLLQLNNTLTKLSWIKIEDANSEYWQDIGKGLL